jgi:heme a synthase
MQTINNKGNKAVAIWLLIGVGMIIIQVLLGGITRLTGSGLSITEWKPILGAVPPTTETAWLTAFEKYKQIGQYKYINQHFTLNDFKFIYFWEWFHRVWARLIGIVFIIGFVYLLAKKYLNNSMVNPMLILFLLGGLQGTIGWLMVQSGLNEEDVYVNHIRLAVHFIAALILLVYTLWFVCRLIVNKSQVSYSNGLHNFTAFIIGALALQLIYGAFMAGLKAATAATTWPAINGEWLPHNFKQFGNRQYTGLQQLTNNPIAVHLIHRSLAYILVVLIIIWFTKAGKAATTNPLLQKTKWLPLALVLTQVLLGILTVLNATNNKALLWLGVAHQFIGMLFLMCMVYMLYIIRKQAAPIIATAYFW